MGKKNKYKEEAAPAPQQPQQQQQQQQTPRAAPAPSQAASTSGAGQQPGGQQAPQGQQQGGWQQSGQQRAQGGQQRPQGQQPGGWQQSGQQRGHGGQQGGQQSGQQGGYQQRGPPGGQPGGQQGGQQGGYQQRGSQGGQQGAYQQRGPGAAAPLPPQVGTIPRGTLGRPGQCGVNYLDVDMSKMPSVAYHYDVTLTPERPKKFYRNAFEVFRVQFLNNKIAAFDGRKSCYAVEKLPNVSGEVEVIDRHGRTVHYTVTVKETDNSTVELSSLHNYMKDKIYDKPMRALQCLEVVLAAPCNMRSIRAGRSFFKTSDNGSRVSLGDGYEALVGLYQSFVLGDKPFVNVDVSHKSFPIAVPVAEYITSHALGNRVSDLRNYTLTDGDLWRIIPFIKGINIVYEPPKSFATAPRVYKVNGFSAQPACSQKFELDGKTMTIEAYFASRNYKLQYPKMQCLHVGPPVKNIYLPIELCRIEEGQALNRKDGVNQVSAMIKFAATSTTERKNKIMNLLQYFNHNADPTVSRFGIHIAGDFITVSTRCLAPPQLEYKNNNFKGPMNGSWYMDRCQFLKVIEKSHKWAILNCDSSRIPYGKLSEMESLVVRQAKNVNVCLEPKADIRNFRDERNLDEHFKELKGKKYDLVFVIIPTRNGPTYDVIKQKAELQHGILTQCIKQFSLERRLNPQLVDNVLLKVNSKLNGINHKIKDDVRTKLSNVMYLGADVAHPSPDQRDIPSVVGVAASHDLFGASYNMQYRLQCGGGGGAREEIEDMDGIVTEHLRVYHQYHKRYPEHIIYYRDGVSDGQFMKIKNLELKGIYAACSKLGIKPKMCCVIVVKRHHTRFFPLGTPHPRNKFNNVDPGTVVDRTIVHPNEMQFFMVSHQSIQGTAKPTRYNVIENTGNLDIDLLQQLTYNLCHMFPRCNRSVSYPAPAYLAHLAAARGRVYISGTRLSRSPQEEYKRRLINPEFMKMNPMYFV
ncbi:protein argonaute-2 isoform X2 [Drosophila innubila]|uniref:protein argonaute-2 isoform X2 n=1 Tax=Drosophila innubila TaxID=198719 RepID=UPI00148E4690|nr:protein argonaute-2 isoform X2 [Drosophila innubila]